MIDFEDLDVFLDSLDTVVKNCSKESKKFLRSEARNINKKAKQSAKQRLKTLRKAKDETSYMAGFKTGKVFIDKYDKGSLGIKAYNKAPHAHLIEDGHIMLVGNKKGRKQKISSLRKPKQGESFVKGRHIIRDTSRAYEGEFHDNMLHFVDEQLVKGLTR